MYNGRKHKQTKSRDHNFGAIATAAVLPFELTTEGNLCSTSYTRRALTLGSKGVIRDWCEPVGIPPGT